ncbi:MAG: 23S rRNA (uracil(1939)-C(5))-methyltransferase RlmD [Armatimonadetes bacterium]|nr:23S rRNA (uracil(1939)-C(5))-methyltransferase RlmD [Armatimonadota bacterium]
MPEAVAFRRQQEVTVRVDRLSYGGRGVGRVDGYVVFVPDTAPGDVVRARLVKVKRNYAEAALVEVVEPSPARAAPPCPYFGPCGGCLWQHIPYAAQAAAKEAIVRESLAHLAGLRDLPVHPVVAADDPWYYRNKMEFTFAPDGLLGLHRRGAFDRIVGIESCLLQSPLTTALLGEVREFVTAHGLTCYNPRTHAGLLRHLVVREGKQTGEFMVAIITSAGEFPQAREFAGLLASGHPEIASVLWGVNPSLGDAVTPERVEVLHGRPFIQERLGGLTFRIGLETFFQTNTAQAEKMVASVRAAAALAGTGPVVDLYCGVGTFALLLARGAASVHGIEVVPAAVEAARENARLNGITNAEFEVGDARRGLPALIERIGRPDLLLLDPPRSGAGERVMRRVVEAAPRRAIYVSCNPTTLAPDLRVLVNAGYAITSVQPLDLFPQTYHVECVVALEAPPALPVPS